MPPTASRSIHRPSTSPNARQRFAYLTAAHLVLLLVGCPYSGSTSPVSAVVFHKSIGFNASTASDGLPAKTFSTLPKDSSMETCICEPDMSHRRLVKSHFTMSTPGLSFAARMPMLSYALLRNSTSAFESPLPVVSALGQPCVSIKSLRLS